MRSSARSALPTLLTLFCFAASLFAQSPAKQPAAKTPGGSVSGRVTIKDKPAPGVQVALRKSDSWIASDTTPKAVTDQDGVYRITNVAPGSYQVMTATPAYVPADASGRKSVVIAEDENVEGINFSLVRGGVITGKVTDADGRPVIQQQVEFYRAEGSEQQSQSQPRTQYPERSAQTDDRGIYRSFGLLPGRYKVSAGRSETSMTSFSMTPITYTQVFHPDVKDSAKATVIEVSEGSEATNVDITLGPTLQMFSASGRMINSENGAPAPNIRFGLHRLLAQRTEYINSSGSSNARGEFTIEGLIPGKYGVFLFTNQNSDLRAQTTTFEVIDQDVTGVTIKLAKGATISGVVVLESDDKAAQRKLLEMMLRGFVEMFPATGSSTSSAIGPDGSFRLTGLPNGFANFSLGPAVGPYLATGFVIARVERDGIVVPRIEVKDGETVTGVKVFVRYGSATLRGVVNLENGTLPPGARVFIRLSKLGETTPAPMSYLRQPEVDARGHFFIENIPPGMYEIRAWVSGGNIRRVFQVKRDVSLTDGAVTNVTMPIDLAALTNP
jgi:protocatechuate 3,4-dioxygenase beta subunit